MKEKQPFISKCGFVSKSAIIAATLFSCCALFAQANVPQPNLAPASADAKLLEDYVKAKGYTASIVFDASNIKQFWVDKTVFCLDGSINIAMTPNSSNGFESVPLRIQLINVNERQDCKVEVISESKDADFVVMDSKSKVLSKSSAEQPFVQYPVASATFHLEDTDCSFNLKFSSKMLDTISIKKIILSFSENKNSSFLASPGILNISRENISVSSATVSEDKTFAVTGKQSRIFASNFIIVSDNSLETSVKVKNAGEKPARIYIGFAVYTKDRSVLDYHNYPYKNVNNVLTVVSSEAGSDKIIVDSFSEGAKNCYLALNAEEDLSDIPNTTFAEGRIVEVKKLDDGKAEIKMDKPQKTALKAGTKVRIHGQSGAYLYTNNKVLQPGAEEVFTSSIKKDDTFLQYSSKAFSRGVYAVKPIILSYSVDTNDTNTIEISDYTVSY